MSVPNDAVQNVGWDLTEAILEQIEPTALRYKRRHIERAASQRDAFLGEKDDALALAAMLLNVATQVLQQAAQGEGREALLSVQPERAAAMVAERVQGEIGAREAAGSADEVGAALRSYFSQHPSSVDSILGLLLASSEAPPTPASSDTLSRCVLKLVDGQEHVSTGFVICKHGHVLTAEHVVQGMEEIKVEFRRRKQDGQKVEHSCKASVEHADPERDVAILKLHPGQWEALEEAGAECPELSTQWQPRDCVLCSGYQEHHTFADPFMVEAFVKAHDPLLAVRFRDGVEQECLVLVIPRDNPAVVPGMSGGPVLNTISGRQGVVAMVMGATREAWVRQRWQGEDLWELASSGRYGFAVPLSHVKESWRAFDTCCLSQGRRSSQGGSAANETG